MQINKYKTIILMVLLIALSGLIIFNSQEKNATNYEKNTVAIDYQQHYEKPSTKNNTKKNTQQIPDKEIIEPIAKTIFDDDPYVNSIIIGQKYQHCTDILSYMKINNAEISIYTKFKTSKPEYYKRTMEYCQNIHKQHPEFNLDQVQNSNNYPPTSYLGRFLSDLEFAFSQLTSDLNSVKIALKNTDPNLMLTPNYGLSYSVIVPDLRLILKSQQNDYALIIAKYAEILYACRLGADCGENSAIVFNTCLYNENLCANSIDELIKLKFSNGQQADIEIAYQYLVDFYMTKE